MPDRAKVISTLEEIKTQTAGIGLDSAVIAHGFIDKVIALLKEQPEIIRCKYCKHHGKGTCSAAAGIAYPPPDEWFCADGEEEDE